VLGDAYIGYKYSSRVRVEQQSMSRAVEYEYSSREYEYSSTAVEYECSSIEYSTCDVGARLKLNTIGGSRLFTFSIVYPMKVPHAAITSVASASGHPSGHPSVCASVWAKPPPLFKAELAPRPVFLFARFVRWAVSVPGRWKKPPQWSAISEGICPLIVSVGR
jgi:hypothetical protein